MAESCSTGVQVYSCAGVQLYSCAGSTVQARLRAVEASYPSDEGVIIV